MIRDTSCKTSREIFKNGEVLAASIHKKMHTGKQAKNTKFLERNLCRKTFTLVHYTKCRFMVGPGIQVKLGMSDLYPSTNIIFAG